MIFNFGHYNHYYKVGLSDGQTIGVKVKMRHGTYVPLNTKEQMAKYLGQPVMWVQACSRSAYMATPTTKER